MQHFSAGDVRFSSGRRILLCRVRPQPNTYADADSGAAGILYERSASAAGLSGKRRYRGTGRIVHACFELARRINVSSNRFRNARTGVSICSGSKSAALAGRNAGAGRPTGLRGICRSAA